MFNALGWAKIKTKKGYNAEMTERHLKSWMPKRHWVLLNETYAGLGQLLKHRIHKQRVKKILLDEAAKKGTSFLMNVQLILNEYGLSDDE